MFALVQCRNGELECQQDGIPFFDVYKTHVPSVQHSCVSLTDIDYYANRNGTRNIRLSDNGCTDIQEEESELQNSLLVNSVFVIKRMDKGKR